MQEAIENAISELKRADHLIFVSLKYTRTVDMLKHVIERLIGAIDCSLDILLLYAKSKKKVDEIPQIPGLKIEMVRSVFEKERKVPGYLEFYALLRKLDRADFIRAREFRRHVTMTADVDGKPYEVTIDVINEFYEKTREIFIFAKEFAEDKKKI